MAAGTRRGERRRLLVVAALIERRGRVLLTQRREDQSFPLAWEFPGGKVEAGEAPEAALVREIQEELGLVVAVKEVAELIFYPYPEFDLVMPVYRAVIVKGVPRPVQVEAIAWVPTSRLSAFVMPPADRPFAEKLALDARKGSVKSARRIAQRRWPQTEKPSRRLRPRSE